MSRYYVDPELEARLEAMSPDEFMGTALSSTIGITVIVMAVCAVFVAYRLVRSVCRHVYDKKCVEGAEARVALIKTEPHALKGGYLCNWYYPIWQFHDAAGALVELRRGPYFDDSPPPEVGTVDDVRYDPDSPLHACLGHERLTGAKIAVYAISLAICAAVAIAAWLIRTA